MCVKVLLFLLLIMLISCEKTSVRFDDLGPDRTALLQDSTRETSPGIISGEVLDLIDDSPISGALLKIKLGDEVITTARTNEKGFFKVQGLPPETYQIIAEAPNYGEFVIESVLLKSGAEVVTHFFLSPRKIIPELSRLSETQKKALRSKARS